MSNIQPERLNLLNFFERLPNTQFVIPVYQRNYVWTVKKHVKKFLDDYNEILNGNKKKHFIGIMMYLHIQKGIGFSELSIVDGQQRLVTTFLMLHALKEIAIETGDKSIAEKINDIYLINKYATDDHQKLKLKPLISSDNVYSKIASGKINEVTKDEKKSVVYLNYIAIKNFLKSKYGQYPIDKLLSAIDGFYFVAIPLSDTDDAQGIFETINSAGYELTKADLIRNYLLMNVESGKQEYLYKNYWLPLETKLGSIQKMESFFRMFLANQTYVLSDMDNIYIDFQKWFSDFSKNNSLEEIMKHILLYSKYYVDLFMKDKFDIEPIINKALVEFRKNTVEPTAPLLMEVYHLYDSFNAAGERLVSKENFASIIELFTIYNIRRNICNLRSGVLTRIVPPMLKDIIESCGGSYENIYSYTVKFLVDNNKNKASFMPDDEYLRNNLLTSNAYAMRTYLKTIFERIESFNNPATIDFSNLSIEHLMPQTPTKEWLENLGITREVYDANLHRIGNLTLATHPDNSKMSNNSFEYKKQILKKTSHLRMNIEILEKEKWDIEEIDERSHKLIEKMIKLYPYAELGEPISDRYEIFMSTDDSKAKAYIYDDLTVEVIVGTKFKQKNGLNLSELLEEEIIKESGLFYEFISSYSFASLKEATEFLTNEDISEWELWEDSDGDPLNLKLRAYLVNKAQSKNK